MLLDGVILGESGSKMEVGQIARTVIDPIYKLNSRVLNCDCL
jgi:hypothetical protein